MTQPGNLHNNMQSNFLKIPLLLSVIFFVFSSSIFIFLYKAINNSVIESQYKEGKWQGEALRRNEIKTLNDSAKTVESDKVQLEKHFAQSSDIVPFLDTIEGLAPKVGVKTEVTSVDISDDRITLLVSMKASGNFSSLYKFLTLLENSPYQLEFTGVNIQKETGADVGKKSNLYPKWNVTFKIKLLSFTL